jgi:hypothetical protein
MLLLMIAVVTGALWNFIPESLTPRDSLLGKIRIGVGVLNCHVALVLWPCAYFLVRGLLRQTRWIERIKFSALIALSLWMAWGATQVVIWFWTSLFEWLTC